MASRTRTWDLQVRTFGRGSKHRSGEAICGNTPPAFESGRVEHAAEGAGMPTAVCRLAFCVFWREGWRWLILEESLEVRRGLGKGFGSLVYEVNVGALQTLPEAPVLGWFTFSQPAAGQRRMSMGEY